MRNFFAILLAAFLAAPAALAADRPVGPETGQARTSNDEAGFGGGPDELGNSENDWRELRAWDSCSYFGFCGTDRYGRPCIYSSQDGCGFGF